MNMLRAVLAGSLLMLPAIAAAQDVKIDFDKAYDFSTVKTYDQNRHDLGQQPLGAPRPRRDR